MALNRSPRNPGVSAADGGVRRPETEDWLGMEAHEVDLTVADVAGPAPVAGGSAMRWAPWVAALAVLVIVSLLVVGQTERRGTQTPSPEIRIGAAPSEI